MAALRPHAGGVPTWIDSHSHLDAPEFDGDRDAVLARAHAAGVARQVVPAVAAAGWPILRRLAAATPGLHPAYGLHPVYLARHRPEDLAALPDWIEAERPCAVGECGLDYFVPDLDPEAQARVFTRQLEIAREARLPVIVHARRAVDAVIAAVRRIGGLRGVVHSYGGSEEQARQLWQMGFLLGIGGPATHERASRLRALVARMPLEFLLLETDSPDQPPAGHRGERNEPARLPGIGAVVAALRGIEPEALAAATCRNARRLFGLPEDVAP